MTSCQISSLANYTFTAAMTVGVFGLAVLAIILVIRVLAKHSGKLEMNIID